MLWDWRMGLLYGALLIVRVPLSGSVSFVNRVVLFGLVVVRYAVDLGRRAQVYRRLLHSFLDQLFH